jgi:predicted RNA-binding protein YlxR (DUF448 family)
LKKIPMRMCIVCRQMKPKKEMLRVVRSPEGEFSIDETGKKSGRGAYVCGEEACIKKCVKTKAMNRNFKTDVGSDIYEKIDELNKIK